jgi:WD40 repeat protein/serine/threonine protein kinase
MTIFHRAMEIDEANARAQFISQLCSGDAALRAEVNRLVDAFSGAGSLLRKGVEHPHTERHTPPAEGPGSLIGPYKLLEKIGEGGMGLVFMAEQTEPVKRRVALKLIKAGMDSSEVIARFEAERQALALMDHPNIARVLDAGKTATGRPYFVMELVKGIPITKFADDRKLTPRERLELFKSVCEAVQHAHQRGIIHRDVKPTNVLVASYDGKPVPKVIDFGVAKAMGQQLTEKTLFTGFGGIVGTLEYMSPEQAEFNSLDIDTRTDVYSLGVLLYELLTGSTPLTRQRLKDAALVEVLRLIKEEEPPKPSTRLSTAKGEALATISDQRHMAPATLTNSIRGDLDVIVMKALEKDRNRRYASARDLALDVQHYLSDEPLLASPPSMSYRLRRFVRRNKGAVAVIALTMLLLLLGIAGTSIGLVRALDAERDSRLAAQKEMDQRLRADRQRELAESARTSELRQLYATDMLLANRAVMNGPLGRAFELLDAWLPERHDGKDFRRREWHMLHRQCDTSEMTLVGHTGPLRALAWTKDEKLIASGGADRVIRIWDAKSGKCVHTFVGHAGVIFDLAFTKDGKLLASASADCTVRIWETETGRERHVLRGHILPVYAVAFHPDGKQLASGGGDAVIKVWDANSGAEQFALQAHETGVSRLQFDAPGQLLAGSGISRTSILWNLTEKKPMQTIVANGDIVFTPDFEIGLYAYPGGKIRFRTIKDKTADEGGFEFDTVHAVAMNDTARIAAVAGSDETLRVVNRDNNSTLAVHRGHRGIAKRLLLSADSKTLLSAGDDGTVRLWKVAVENSSQHYAEHHQHNVTAAAYSGDGDLLATGDYLGSIAIWNSKSGERVRFLGSHYLRRKNDKEAREIGSGKPLAAGVIMKNKVGFSAGASTANPIVEVLTSVGHGGAVRGLAFTPDKKTLVSAGAAELIIWDMAGGKPIATFEHPTLVSSMAMSADGTLVATGCWDDIVRVFRVPSGELVHQFEGHDDDVMAVAFHPSGKELTTGSRDQTAIIWDIATGKISHRLRRHSNTVSAICYSPDGKRLITGGMDKAIHVWNAASGEFESTAHGHIDGITSMAVSADGELLVTASDGTADPMGRCWS